MRKVTTINLNHNAYQIDEDGYEALRRYLEEAERALAGNPDLAEIMQDLEQAIADKCRMAMGQYKTVVSAAQIEQILREMGPVVSGEPASDQASAGSGTAGDGARPRARRAYRLQEGKYLTGVCAGLAAFAGVDVTWVRVAAVLLTIFTSGVGLIVYVVLVFLMPVATTPDEISAAHGQPFNAQELVDRARSRHEQFRSERHARRQHKRRGQHFRAQTPPHGSGTPRPPGAAARVAGGIMLPVFTAISAGWFAIAALAAIFVWQGFAVHSAGWYQSPFHLAALPRWIPLVAVVAIYVVLALPISAGRRTALYYANGGQAHGWADAWSGLLWLALVGLIMVGAWLAMPHLQDFLQHITGGPAQTWVTLQN